MSDQEKIAAWDQLAADWQLYCQQGPYFYDWDSDSRAKMTELTGLIIQPWWWGKNRRHQRDGGSGFWSYREIT